MARKLTLAAVVLAVVAAAALLEGTAAQTVHTVGGSTGWAIPSGSAFYSNWASNQNYAVGDTLVFNFAAGAHDVAQVTKAAYDSCSSASPISLNANPPVNVTLSTSGQHYFICTFGQHCTSGQKLAVNVLATSGSPPTATPSPSPTQTPTPTPSPAQSPTPTPSPTPSAATPSPTPASAPSPTAQSPAPSTESPTNSPPPPPAGETPTEAASPTGSTTPPPPPGSSAPRTVAAAFGMVVMSVGLAALF